MSEKRSFDDSSSSSSSSSQSLVVKKTRTEETALITTSSLATQQQLVTVQNTKDGLPPRTSSLPAPTMRLAGHGSAVNIVQFSPDGAQLLSGGADNSLFLWQMPPASEHATKEDEGKEATQKVKKEIVHIAALKGHTDPILDACWGRDGDVVFSSSVDGTAAMWDLETTTRVRRFRGHKKIVNSVSINKRNTPHIITSSDDSTVKVWNINHRHSSYEIQSSYPVLSAVFNEDATQIYMAGLNNVISVYDTRTLETPLYRLYGHKDSITSLAVSHDFNYLLSNGMDNTLRIWDIRPFVSSSSSASSSPTDPRLLTLLRGHTHDMEQNLLKCCWNADDSLVSCGSSDRYVNIWNVTTNELLYKLPGHTGSVNSTHFHPTQPIIASASTDRQIYVGEFNATS